MFGYVLLGQPGSPTGQQSAGIVQGFEQEPTAIPPEELLVDPALLVVPELLVVPVDPPMELLLTSLPVVDEDVAAPPEPVVVSLPHPPAAAPSAPTTTTIPKRCAGMSPPFPKRHQTPAAS